MLSLTQKLSRALWHTSPQNTSNDLADLVAATVTQNNTYGGIDRSVAANSFWLPSTTALNANLSLSNLQTAYGNVTFGNEEPDTIITTQAGFNALWGLMVGNIRYVQQDEETARAGFKRHLVNSKRRHG